jgi:hypothetical protein
VFDVPAVADAGVVVEDVDAAVGLEDRRGKRLDRIRVGDVERVGDGAAPGGLDLPRDRRRSLRVDVGDVQLRAVAGKRQRGRAADPGAAAGDDGDLSGEVDL